MGVGSKPDNIFRQIAPTVWMKEAVTGWVVYTEDDGQYFAESELAEAQAYYEAAKVAGKWASSPKQAHTGQ